MPPKLLSVNWFWQSGIVSLLSLALVAPGQAQIIPDNTLPQNSQVVPGCTNCLITGGTVRGANLFHSFREFSVPTGGTAWFNNPANIQTILMRVTGDRASTINGTLRTNNTASLFLLNPNGITFGTNARLQVGGSFLATTASSFRFADGSEFSATNPTPALLTVSIPIGLQFGANPAPIVHRPPADANDVSAFRVLPGRTLALVGGELNLAGGSLLAQGGRIELGAVGGSSFVGLSPENNFTVNYAGVSTFRDIQLTENALVRGVGVGGGITIAARNLRVLEGARLVSTIVGAGQGGDITANVTDTVDISGTATSPTRPRIDSSSITTSTLNGNAGNIIVSAQRINLLDGGRIASTTQGTGNTGNVSISATATVTAIGTSTQSSSISSGIFTQALPSTTGNVGTLTVDTNALVLQAGAQISSVTFGRGAAGTLRVNAATIDLSGVVLTPDGKMFFDQRNVPLVTGLFASADQGSTGNAASLIIETQQLRMRDGAVVQTSTLGTGDAGSLSINADSIELIGTAPDGISPTVILAASGGIPRSRIGIPQATGKGGSITIATNNLLVQNGAEIAVSSLNPDGNSRGAGDLQIQAQNITLSDRGRLNAETASGNGGNINLEVQEVLLLRRNSSISATAGTAQVGGDGGNVTIRSPFVVAIPSENSDITANAFTGRGGRVEITTQGIFGIQFRDRLTPASDITASSEFGLNGTVIINSLNLDPNRGLIALPGTLVDPTRQIRASCAAAPQVANRNQFVITGRGGLPESPEAMLSADHTLVSFIEPVQAQSENSAARVPATSQTDSQMITPIIEAQGWKTDRQGLIYLVADAAESNPRASWQRSTECFEENLN